MAGDSIIIKKKKVHGHGGHHGGSWKVAYADFVTAMMAFFMVLWIMGLSDDTKMQIQGYFNDPSGFMKNPPRSKNVVSLSGASKMSQRMQRGSETGDDGQAGVGLGGDKEQEGFQMKKKIKEIVQNNETFKTYKDKIVVTINQEGLLIEFIEEGNIFFESGSAVISDKGRQLIKEITPAIIATDRYIRIEGHTDAKPYSGNEYTNIDLSTDRANAFRRYLGKLGVPLSRFKGVCGFADSKLRIPTKPFAAANRRVALLLPWKEKATKEKGKQIERQKTDKALRPKPLADVNIRHPEMGGTDGFGSNKKVF
jgi:chemotaxis protein MotB